MRFNSSSLACVPSKRNSSSSFLLALFFSFACLGSGGISYSFECSRHRRLLSPSRVVELAASLRGPELDDRSQVCAQNLLQYGRGPRVGTQRKGVMGVCVVVVDVTATIRCGGTDGRTAKRATKQAVLSHCARSVGCEKRRVKRDFVLHHIPLNPNLTGWEKHFSLFAKLAAIAFAGRLFRTTLRLRAFRVHFQHTKPTETPAQ